MKQSGGFLVGIILAVVLGGGAFLAPHFLDRSVSPTTSDSLQQAELARRQLHVYDSSAARLAARQDVEALKNYDSEKLVARLGDEFKEQVSQLTKDFDAARALDRKARGQLPASSLATISADANGLRSGLAGTEKLATDNAGRLNSAIEAARKGSGGGALGASQILGMAKLVEASDRLAEARRLRSQLTTTQAAALSSATNWTVIRAEMDHFSKIDAAKVVEGLKTDLGEFKAESEKANAEAAELAARVAEREQTLATIASGLAQGRAEMIAAEQAGFQAGNDSAYEAHRQKLAGISKRLSELQDAEQLLTLGGWKGAEFADDDALNGARSGGEETIGIEEYRRRLSVAKDRADRLTKALAAIEKRTKEVEEFGKSARGDEQRLGGKLADEQKSANKIIERMGELNKQAVEKEDAALASAREAVAAFGAAKQSASKWKSAASSLKSEEDREGRNERLRLISGDSNTVRTAELGEAEAKGLLGRIYGERLLAVEGYKDTLERLTKAIKGATYDAKALQELIDSAKNEANTALADARETYKRLVGEDAKSAWAHNAALASILMTSARVDPSKAGEHTKDAIDAISRSATQFGKSPYYKPEYVALRELLAPGSSDAPSAPGSGDKPADGTKTPDAPTGGG